MKKLIVLFLSLWYLGTNAQFEAVNYDFEGLAMSLQYNPGIKIPYQKTFAIPFLNNTVFAGSSGFSLYDLFAPRGSFEQKLYKTIDGLQDTDVILFHLRQDIFSTGHTDDLGRFKYFGMYWEFDHITYTPAQWLKLGLYGNVAYMDKRFDAKFLASKTELVETFYYGIQKQVSRRFTIGYRFKLYSGIANIQSTGNTGQFYTTTGQHNYYLHHLEKVNLSYQSSGYKEGATQQYYLGKLLFSGNYGPGIDFGLSYQLNPKTTLSASLLDLGFIYYTKDIQSESLTGNYTFEGVNIQFPEHNFIDYWKDIKDNFNHSLQTKTNKKAYISWRPTSLYTSIKYGLGNLFKQSCENFLHPISEYTNFIGLTGFAQYRPVTIHWGASAFFEKKWSKHFYTKFNFTADNYSYAALGGGLVWNIGRLQLSLSADNLVGLSDLARSNKQAVYFGLNIVKFQ